MTKINQGCVDNTYMWYKGQNKAKNNKGTKIKYVGAISRGEVLTDNTCGTKDKIRHKTKSIIIIE